jgi:hypothetical protein
MEASSWKLDIPESGIYKKIQNPSDKDVEDYINLMDNEARPTVTLSNSAIGRIMIVGGANNIVAVHCRFRTPTETKWYRVIDPNIPKDDTYIELNLIKEPTWVPSRCAVNKETAITAALDFYHLGKLSKSLVWVDYTGNVVNTE